MGIDITTYRIRIRTFSSSRQHSFKSARIESYKSSKKTRQGCIFCQANIRILFLVLLVLISKCEARTNKLFSHNFYPLDRCLVTPRGVYSYRLCSILPDGNNFKWELAASFGYKPPNIIRPNLKCTGNFYARYTYGNRSNRGIKLSH